MGLSCRKPNSDSAPSSTIEKSEAWTRSAGFLFRPGFHNELNESVYEKSQMQYLQSWKRIQQSMKRRRSALTEASFNYQLFNEWKPHIRAGVPDNMCREIILKLFSIIPNDSYWKDLKDNFEGSIPETFLTVPTFSSIQTIEKSVPKLYITSSGLTALKRILWCLYRIYDHIKYCPQLPAFTSILLVYLNEDEAYYLCRHLLMCDDSKHLIIDKTKFKEFIRDTLDLIIKEEPRMKVFENSEELRKIISEMVRNLFIGYFRISCVLRIVMNFLTEGFPIIAKCAAAIFSSMCEKGFSKSASLTETVKAYTFSQPSCDEFLNKSFRIKFNLDEDIDESCSVSLRPISANLDSNNF